LMRDGEVELSVNLDLDELNEMINTFIRKGKLKIKEFQKLNFESGNFNRKDYHKVRNHRVLIFKTGRRIWI